MIMKKILILLSLVIVLTSCGAKKEPTVKEIDASVKKMMEEQAKTDTNVEKVEETETETGTDSDTLTPNSEDVTPASEVNTPTEKDITKDDVAKHNKKSDCYTIIDAKVYDITSFFGKHPGGDEKIIWLCWIDWSAKFNTVHWKNEKAIMTKDKYLIWDLAK